ncbi:hypothetical protein CA13_17510 [Planctomycetes bacterium CA13]|uniref:Uncharacterized protein n=1 Tax=Novipirellula herctigrandis TaxID=2527986 RepID=A0A5C5YZ05_9BACT|nr:hypothetical protein CA13_17510 [Planctomycetes bacterium CA13]
MLVMVSLYDSVLMAVGLTQKVLREFAWWSGSQRQMVAVFWAISIPNSLSIVLIASGADKDRLCNDEMRLCGIVSVFCSVGLVRCGVVILLCFDLQLPVDSVQRVALCCVLLFSLAVPSTR